MPKTLREVVAYAQPSRIAFADSHAICSADRRARGRSVSEENAAEDREPIAHQNVVVLTTQDAAELDALVGTPEPRGFIWRRLDATQASADPTAIMTIVERLAAAGISASGGELSSPGE